MRIALITREYPPETPWGGIASFYVQLARAFLDHGHDVEVFAQGIHREHTEVVDGVTVHRVLCRRNMVGELSPGDLGGNTDLGDFAFSLAQEFLRAFLIRHQQKPFELVEGHEHLGVNALINQYAPAGVVTVTRYHTSYHTMIKRGLVDWPASSRITELERLSLTSAGFRVSTSSFIDAVTREDFDFAETAPVLANFTAQPPGPAPDAAPIPRENLIIFAGRMVLEHKRPDLAAQAFAAIASEFPGWRIEFAGADMPLPGGSTTWQLCASHLAACSSDRWAYRGVLPAAEMDRLYRRAKVIIIPSRFESFGMVAIEAMHRGCVPIVSDRTALVDATADGALEFRNGDLANLVEKLRPLLRDESVWRDQSQRCQARAASAFNRDHLVQQNLRLFESLLQRQRLESLRAEPMTTTPTLPMISIVTPSYNQGPFIEETINSVWQQGYPRFEHIVVDGGSTDATLPILRKYPHVRWVSEKDEGQTHAINKGLLQARGEIVAYLNSDDVYRPRAFETVGRFFADHPEAQIVVGNCDIIDGESKVSGHFKAIAGDLPGLVQYWRWSDLHCTPQQSVFWRRSLLAEVGLLDVRFDMVMDYNFWLRVAEHHRFHVIDQTLAAFRIMAGTKTGSRTDEMYVEEYAASREFWHLLPWPRRVAVGWRARRQVAQKMVDLGEHYLLSTTQGRRPLHMLGVGWTYWPPIMFYPRFLLSFLGAAAKGKNSLSPRITRLHRWHLHRLWLRQQKS